MKSLSLEIVTPEKIVLQEEGIDSIFIEFLESEKKGETEIGILPDHAPMLVRLSIAPLKYTKNGNTSYAVIAGGFLEVKDNKATIISAGAELVEKEANIDLAITARKRVETWLEKGVGKVGFDEKAAEADIKKAAVELYKSSTK